MEKFTKIFRDNYVISIINNNGICVEIHDKITSELISNGSINRGVIILDIPNPKYDFETLFYCTKQYYKMLIMDEDISTHVLIELKNLKQEGIETVILDNERINIDTLIDAGYTDWEIDSLHDYDVNVDYVYMLIKE